MDPTELLGLNGHALSVQEKTAVKCSLAVLSRQRVRPVRLWGKVTGVQNDYLIASAEGESILDAPSAFFSIDGGSNWTALAPATPEQEEFAEQIRGPFFGDPAYEYKLQKDIPPEDPSAVNAAAAAAAEAALGEHVDDEAAAEPDEEGDPEEGDAAAADGAEEGGEDGEEERRPTKKRPKHQVIAMAEAARLSHFIAQHDAHCRLVPRGALIRRDNGAIVPNRTFRGLEVEQATQMKHYFKLHVEDDAARNKALFGSTYSAGNDFLVSSIEDMPKGVWALKYDPSLAVVTLQNLCFLGSLFFHRIDSAEYGQFYVGSGERNLDLCFMLP